MENAVIESTRIDYERGILTAWINLDYGGTGQGFGGYVLDRAPDKSGGRPYGDRRASRLAGHFISRVIQVVGADSWESLKGKPVRVVHTHSKVHKIGHYLKDRWFDPAEEFEDLIEEEKEMEMKWRKLHEQDMEEEAEADGN
jgi:hypothetical protein